MFREIRKGTQIMAQSNRERVTAAMDMLQEGLKAYIERILRAKYGANWEYQISSSVRDTHFQEDGSVHYDVQVLLQIMWDQWQPVFKDYLGFAEKAIISELREYRNKWAHQNTFSTDDTYRVYDSVYRLLKAIGAVKEAEKADAARSELMRLKYEDQAKAEKDKMQKQVAKMEENAIKSWRDIAPPHQDVASGKFQQAEFAADLYQVYKNRGSDEYRLPREFFQRTYVTRGLHALLKDALQRLSGIGGNPVVELQTNFGGGKTHSLLALYHLFSGARIEDLIGMDQILLDAGVSKIPVTKRAAIIGTQCSVAEPIREEEGCRVNTLWGELAWQLLGKDGYALVAESDRRGVSPGTEKLIQLFERAAPCLLLIDEWVAHTRNLYKMANLPAGSFDTNMSFAQELTEAAKAVPQTLLVVSIPASDIEKGGEGGAEAAERLKSIFGRVESAWQPAGPEESFEIVRRRIFEDVTDPEAAKQRDGVIKIFMDMYRKQPADFPSECQKAEYEQRMRKTYPIHPLLFTMLYDEWSRIEGFQRTRGILRLMASVAHTLWKQMDTSALILPGSVPLGSSETQSELTRYLEDNWRPIIERDIDGEHAISAQIDGESNNLGRYRAAAKVARTIFLGSAPLPNKMGKGLSESQIRLGVVQPGENISAYIDALSRMTERSAHLYEENKRYWYSSTQSITQVARDHAETLEDYQVEQRAEEAIQAHMKDRVGFAKIHIFPESGADIPDEDTFARLILLKLRYTHSTRNTNSSAMSEAQKIFASRGAARRQFCNTLIFLAADIHGVDMLKKTIRQLMAWQYIVDKHDELNLTPSQHNQAKTKLESFRVAVDSQIFDTCIWLLLPEQPNPQGEITWEEKKISPNKPSIGGSSDTIPNAILRRLNKDELLIPKYAGTMLRQTIDQIPLWRDGHVSVRELRDDFAKYIYLPRLQSESTLEQAILDGLRNKNWTKETFAYADRYDSAQQRYIGLKYEQALPAINMDSEAVLVKPEAALQQLRIMEEERAEEAALYGLPAQDSAREIREEKHDAGVISDYSATSGDFTETAPMPPQVKRYRRYFGRVAINPRLMATDAGKVMEEVVRHLTALSYSEVDVTITIEAHIESGAPETTRRIIYENARTLKFTNSNFDEE